MEKYVGKKYKLKTSDYFDEYLKLIGVGFILRKIATSVTPVTFLTKNEDGSYSMTTDTPVKKVVITFKPGEEFIEDRPDGVKVKSLVIMEDNKLIHTQEDQNGKKSKHVREYSDDLMVVTTTAEEWDGICTRIYESISY